MADLSNKCAHLEKTVKTLKSKENFEDFYSFILDSIKLQHGLQKYIYEEKRNLFKLDKNEFIKNKNRIFEWLIGNKIAIDDEISELLEATGGKYGHSSWKWWKKDFSKIQDKLLTDILTNEDIIELKFEIIDIYHFLLNYLVLAKILLDKDLFFNFLIKEYIDNEIPDRNEFNAIFTTPNEFNTVKHSVNQIKHFKLRFDETFMDIYKEYVSSIEFSDGVLLKTFSSYIISKILDNIYSLFILWNKVVPNTYIEDFYFYYKAKNIENINRQDRGY